MKSAKVRLVFGAIDRFVVITPKAWMVESLDKEARHLGVPQQALIKLWIAERLPKYRGVIDKFIAKNWLKAL
ncbi:hypothetical protein [Actinobacillus porcinus]|uniref:hypothetical protein n=1 Tax=Actinobacillus porcinus TaxID=51048 RepID=UPI002354E66D|nr:hypothetical protein [Actinobacillus porcinus]MCI5764885.1 hypothetical protein [Actinobacillus porcinus]